MRKTDLLARLDRIKSRTVDPEKSVDWHGLGLEVLDIVLDYLNDADIRRAVDKIPFI